MQKGHRVLEQMLFKYTNKQRENMYIEISPRQSGKTTRLVREMEKTLTTSKQSDIIVLITNSKQSANYLINSSVILYINRDRIDIFYGDKRAGCNQIRHTQNIKQVFYDELDFCRDINIINCIQEFHVKRNIDFYVATTSKRERSVKELTDTCSSDPLVLFMQLNGFRYTSNNNLSRLMTDNNILSIDDRIREYWSSPIDLKSIKEPKKDLNISYFDNLYKRNNKLKGSIHKLNVRISIDIEEMCDVEKELNNLLEYELAHEIHRVILSKCCRDTIKSGYSDDISYDYDYSKFKTGTIFASPKMCAMLIRKLNIDQSQPSNPFAPIIIDTIGVGDCLRIYRDEFADDNYILHLPKLNGVILAEYDIIEHDNGTEFSVITNSDVSFSKFQPHFYKYIKGKFEG